MIKHFSENWKRFNPDFEIKLFDNNMCEEFLNNNFSIKHATIFRYISDGPIKADFWRVCVLYKNGGIYIDADMVWINEKSFDTLLEQVNDSNVFAGKNPDNLQPLTRKDKKFQNTICGAVMGSSKNNPLMKLLIDGIENYIKITEKDYVKRRMIHGVCELTGPLYLNRILSTQNITIFPSIYFYPISWHNINDCELHKKIELPQESYTFQYGYSTNNLSEYII